MKPFAIWLAIVAVVFGGYALVSTALQETSRVFVFVDVSFAMDGKDDEIRAELDDIDDRDDAEFALAFGRRSDSELVHGWQDQLDLGGFQVFGPCSLDGIDRFPEASDADERILITTSTSCDTSALTGWTIITLDG